MQSVGAESDTVERMDGTPQASPQDLLAARVARLEQEILAQRSELQALRDELQNRPAGADFVRPRKPSAPMPYATAPADAPPAPRAQSAFVPVVPAPPPTLLESQMAPHPAAAFPNASPPSAFNAPATAPPKRSLENRIGAQLFNRIGIVAILIGVAVFLKLAIDNQWIHPSPTGKIITGLVMGIGIVLWSERFRRKGYPAFSYSLKAVGSGTLYLALWASFHLYHLVPAPVALILMVGVTAWNAAMAWMQDAELLAVYALVGGFATPSLLGPGDGHFAFLFSYLFAMDVAVLFLVSRKPWQRLILGSFPATALYFIGWYSSYGADKSSSNLLLLFVILLASPMLAVALTGMQREGVLEGVLAPLGAAAFLSLGLYSVLEDTGRHGWLPWMAVALAAVYVMLMRARRSSLAEAVHLAIAITFLTVAIPLKASGRWITIGWLAEGTALMWVAARVLGSAVEPKVRAVIRWMASLALLLGVVESLHFWAGQDANSAFWNARFFTELAAIAAVALTAWLARAAANAPPAALPATPSASDAPVPAASLNDHRSFWVTLALIAIPVSHLLAPLAVIRECVAYWNVGPADTAGLRDQLGELNTAAVLLVYGAALLAWTIYRIPTNTTRRTLLRMQAVVYQALGFLVMLFTPLFGSGTPAQVIWNSTAFFELIGLAAVAWSVYAAWQQARSATPAATSHDFWPRFAAAGFIAFNLMALFAGVHEILTYFALHATTTSTLADSVTISAWLMLYAAALLTLGFVRNMAFIRWQGLVLLVFTIGKVFVYDVRNLTSLYRVASIVGLGVLLMAVSFAYQKDWLHLRDPEPVPEPAPQPQAPPVPATPEASTTP